MATLGIAAPQLAGDSASRPAAFLARPIPPRIHTALTSLREALDYAIDLGTSRWEFAVEWTVLRATGVTMSDVRWLVGRGLIDHALESPVESDIQRSFRRCARLTVDEGTCFVLTDSGAELALDLEAAGNAAPLMASSTVIDAPGAYAMKSATPCWDHLNQVLRVGTTVVRQFKVPAADEERILAAFQEQDWASHVACPLPACADGSRLREALDSLNRRQRRPLLHFRRADAGLGLDWSFRAELERSGSALPR